MDLASAKVIGAGLAAIGVGMAATGVGNVFGSFLQGALRNPAAADGQQGRLFIGFAAAELHDHSLRRLILLPVADGRRQCLPSSRCRVC
jgi:F-type H+-transporting ATPase subunit c